MKSSKITQIKAMEILDSRGIPTIKTTVFLESEAYASACVPSGASTGKYEAVELRDNNAQRYLGKGVLQAVENVNTEIAQAINGIAAERQEEIDKKMIELDGTPNKSKAGRQRHIVGIACRGQDRQRNSGGNIGHQPF